MCNEGRNYFAGFSSKNIQILYVCRIAFYKPFDSHFKSTSIARATVLKYHICNTCASLSCSIYANFGCIVVKLVLYRPQFGINFNTIPLYIGLSNADRFARVFVGNELPPNTVRSFALAWMPRTGNIMTGDRLDGRKDRPRTRGKYPTLLSLSHKADRSTIVPDLRIAKAQL